MHTPAAPGRQIAGDIAGIEFRTNECTDSPAMTWRRSNTQCPIIEISAKHTFRPGAQLIRQGCLAPTHNLRVSPGGLNRIGAVRVITADNDVAIGFADGTVWRRLEIAG